MEEYLLGGKGKAVNDQFTGSAEESELSQERIILVSHVLLLLDAFSQETQFADNMNSSKQNRHTETSHAELAKNSKFSHCKIG